MQKYVAVLGRQPQISLAELASLYEDVVVVDNNLAVFDAKNLPEIARLGGTIKIGQRIENLKAFLAEIPGEGKVTIGVSDFTPKASAKTAQNFAVSIKNILKRTGRSVRVVPNQTAVLSSATSLHNRLFVATKIEIIKYRQQVWQVIQLSNIEKYARRDRERPARDARVGMLPPKLAQILINLCGELPAGTRLLDPFCGTGVVLQEAALMGYQPYGTDVNERMIEYSRRNLEWLARQRFGKKCDFWLEIGDATTHTWKQPIGAVACETYLGPPMSQPPAEIKLRQVRQECKTLIRDFLANLAGQIDPGTPVTIAVPAWLRPDGHYERLGLGVDEFVKLRYNVVKNIGSNGDLLYVRAGQVVAREIIVLRKK